MVGISTLLNFIREARSTKAADALKAMVSNTATVSRVINDLGENAWVELPIDQLVPGDLVKLAAGDMIPADLRIIEARIYSWPRPLAHRGVPCRWKRWRGAAIRSR